MLLLLLKYYPEEKNVKCLLLKQQWKNAPEKFEQGFKIRTWPEKQVLVYIIWYGNYIILFVQSDIYIKVLALFVFAVWPWKEVR